MLKILHIDKITAGKIIVFLLTAVALLLVACTPATLRQKEATVHQGGFSLTGQTILPEQWWHSFDDPVLNQLVEQALAGNFTLQSTWDRFDRASAIARKAGAGLWPQLDGNFGFSSQRNRTDSTTTSSQSYDLGLTVNYEIDLWGRIGSSRAAAELDQQASAEEVTTAAITLSAEVAKTWFQLLEQRSQIEVLQQQLKTNRKTLELIDLQFRTGQVGIADLLQQRQIVESQLGDLSLSRGQERVVQNQLAILLGLSPTSFTPPDSSVPGELPPLPDTGLQADLLRQRPDIRSAWLALNAADQRVASAVAERFPRISLTGRASSESKEIEKLFDNWLASLAANLLVPLIDGGQRRAEVDRSKSLAAEALHSYRQTVLDALGEVENALTREQKQLEYLDSLDQQLKLAEQSINRIRDRYLNGAEDYQRVLSSQISAQRLQRTRLTARRELLENRVNLCRALAGGWQLTRPVEDSYSKGE